MTVTLETVVARSEDVLHVAAGDGETVMMRISGGEYYGLGEVGTRIWELIEVPMTVGEICGRLVDEFEVERADCERDVLRFVQQLADHHVAVGIAR